MPRALVVSDHLTEAELEARADPRGKTSWEWARWPTVLMWKRGESARDIANMLGFNVDWARRTVRRYDKDGPDAMRDGRDDNAGQARVGPELLAALVQAVHHEEPPTGGRWTGKKVRTWLNERLPKPIKMTAAYETLHRAKLSWQVPRPRHTQADAQKQEDFKKNARVQGERGSEGASRRGSPCLGRG